MEKIRFGIIGAGSQGNAYARHFKNGRIDNGVLCAVCDIKPEKLDAIKEQLQDMPVKYYDNYLDMIEDKACDVVLIETPHYSHVEIVRECLSRGVHVLCEKPLGVYTKEVKELCKYAKTAEAKFGMMFNQRTNCIYRKMREMILGGELGKIQRVNWIITDWFRTDAYYRSGDWRASWAGEGGGVLINQAPHQIDMLSWIVGSKPVSVRGFCHYGRHHDIEVEDDATAYFTYENGATGVFITTTGEAPGTNRLEVAGTLGKLVCEDEKLVWYKNAIDSVEYCRTSESGYKKPDVEITEVETDGQNPQHVGIMNNFANSLLGLEELFVDGCEGLTSVEFMNAVELSGWLGGAEVTIPVDEDLYLSELNKRIATSRYKK